MVVFWSAPALEIMTKPKIIKALLLLFASIAVILVWIWSQYMSAQNHKAVRGLCESIPPRSSLDDALRNFKVVGENHVMFEGGLTIVRVVGAASCKCKIQAANGKVQSTYALCEH